MAQKKDNHITIKYKKILLLCTTLVLLIGGDVLSLGNIQYSVKWVSCGSKPVLYLPPPSLGENSYPPTSIIIENPSFLRAKTTLINGTGVKLYCGIEQAQTDNNGETKTCQNDDLLKAVGRLGFASDC